MYMTEISKEDMYKCYSCKHLQQFDYSEDVLCAKGESNDEYGYCGELEHCPSWEHKINW